MRQGPSQLSDTCAGAGVLFLCIVSSVAQAQTAGPFESSIEKYRVESQYGPSDAVLNPSFPREGKVELSAGASYSPFSSLMQYTSFHGALAYHINHRHGIEQIWFGVNQSHTTNFVKNEIRDKVDASVQAANSIELPKYTFAASYLFSPYYAKMHLTERTVTHFDVYTGIGFGFVKTREQNLAGLNGVEHSRPGVALTAGLRFLFEPRWALRTELKDLIHSMNNFGKVSTVHSLQMSLSVSLFFGSFPD